MLDAVVAKQLGFIKPLPARTLGSHLAIAEVVKH
jgi:hypothetical protein